MGIYLLSHVDHMVEKQIDDIIVSKAAMNATLAEGMTLDFISSYLDNTKNEALQEKIDAAGSGDSFYSEMEEMRREYLNRNIDESVRKRIVNGSFLSGARMTEVVGTRNLFRHDGETDWASKYYYMRERFDLLNGLAAYFPFNQTDPSIREELVEKLKQDPKFRMEVEKAVREAATSRANQSTSSSDSSSSSSSSSYDSDSSSSYDSSDSSSSYSSPMTMVPRISREELEAENEAVIQRQIEAQLPLKAEEKIKENEDRYKAFKYIVGVYQSSDYHMETLQKIYRYYQDAANAGDPVAQYHLALFLKYLGDLVDPHTTNAERGSEVKRWLEKAKATAVAKGRVEQLEVLFMEAVKKQDRRNKDFEKKLMALTRVEDEKIDMYEEVLIRVRQRIGNSSSGIGNNSGSGTSSSSGSGRSGRNSGSSSSSSSD